MSAFVDVYIINYIYIYIYITHYWFSGDNFMNKKVFKMGR
jgi:hypothetical protein